MAILTTKWGFERSLLIKRENKVALSPAYDLLNTTIVLQSKEEIALPIRGKKSNLSRADFVDYFGVGRLNLTHAVLTNELAKFENSLDALKLLIDQSFLSEKLRESYWLLIQNRWKKIRHM